MARWWVVGALVAVTGCGLFREVPVPAPPAARNDDTFGTGMPASALANPRTLEWTRRLCGKSAKRAAAAYGLTRSRAQLPRLEAVLTAHGLPRALIAVPAVESRFHADARGSHGELGIWQLRPATARRFGLEVTRGRDERMHLERSTQAAARYLVFLHERYDDWPLAIAAYNAGEGRVDRALARRPGATLWELTERGGLPRRSREYVAKVLALVRIVAAPASCGADVPVLNAGTPGPTPVPPALRRAASSPRSCASGCAG
ncbi:MAG TPA: lytic transglycosylase domain-containing protein [Candidatus Eisenbacteria bacterium]|nr:lytic transglycosylase domain-containing protein [Candidatus Eisenbacteria bacterium]